MGYGIFTYMKTIKSEPFMLGEYTVRPMDAYGKIHHVEVLAFIEREISRDHHRSARCCPWRLSSFLTLTFLTEFLLKMLSFFQ